MAGIRQISSFGQIRERSSYWSVLQLPYSTTPDFFPTSLLLSLEWICTKASRSCPNSFLPSLGLPAVTGSRCSRNKDVALCLCIGPLFHCCSCPIASRDERHHLPLMLHSLSVSSHILACWLRHQSVFQLRKSTVIDYASVAFSIGHVDLFSFSSWTFITIVCRARVSITCCIPCRLELHCDLLFIL
ncbi:hypothetical protein C8J56DRAFT_1020870, partial [Mycena floridula]